MSWNGSGTFNRKHNWTQEAAVGTPMLPANFDDDANDMAAAGFGNCMTRDGQGGATANIPLNGYKITGLAAGTTSTDAVNYGQVFPAPTFPGSVTVGGITVSGGTVNMTAAMSVTVPTPAPGDNSNNAASTAFVVAIGLAGALPGQTGKNGRVVGTDGSTSSWVSKLLTTQVFTSSSTWVATTDTVKVTVTGGGGSSGAGANISSGGSGGGTAIKTLTGLTIGATYTVAVGIGGAALSIAGTGNTGGTSSFSGPGISTVSATGGSGGRNGNLSLAPGNGSGGDLNIPGGYSVALVGNQGDYSIGGGTFLSSGGAPGSDGVGYGAGGGGVYGTTTGTAGANGVIVLEY